MKRVSFVSVIIFVILVSTACGSSSSKSSSSTTGSTNKMATMTPAVELAVGTLRLEETSQAVDKKMAAQLLPYWQLIDELNASESTAPQEITAVVENIRAIMTTGQVQAIQNMKLTQNDLAAVLQNAGSADISVGTAKTNNIAQAPGGGGLGEGVPPDGGGMPIDGVSSGGGVITSGNAQQSSSTSQISSSASITFLIEQVITLLEKRINS